MSSTERIDITDAAAAGALAPLNTALRRTLPQARIELCTLPECGGLQLGLIAADFPTGPLPGEVMRDVIAAPAYWAFCWGSGLALARYLLANPHRLQGRRVLDLGSGSGVAGIAAAMAGASEVIACDTDPDARLATACNAALNSVSVRVIGDLNAAPQCDLALLADVLYDAANLPLLVATRARASTVWVADSRIHTLNDPSYRLIATARALTLPNLGEFDEFGTTRIWAHH